MDEIEEKLDNLSIKDLRVTTNKTNVRIQFDNYKNMTMFEILKKGSSYLLIEKELVYKYTDEEEFNTTISKYKYDEQEDKQYKNEDQYQGTLYADYKEKCKYYYNNIDSLIEFIKVIIQDDLSKIN